MKRVLFASIALAFGANAMAQTCASPVPFMTPQAGATASGDTCTAANNIGTLCGLIPSPSNDIIYSFTINTPYTATAVNLTNNTPAWDAGMILLAGACGPNQACVAEADLGGAGAAETINVAGLSNGVHYLIVTSGTGAPATCGSFTITANGTWPVELQSFSVD